ncbi:hypothetical protein [Pseudodesulfovibrio sediminis]|uniref:YubB ferredoxin-like domain-containing protein n=1 Tax=Pseudodesulfovibrio sediminis TaxID=2810563 RepID=A0ABN6EVV8_9BACT|nr:hypothetical protein [Pseudodesulfovibrio sediminis]BCS89256.1 hypothetical protein PSDVSF_24980 [Pseudodesulfovibrio sediminis]
MSEGRFEIYLTEARSGWLEARLIDDDSHYDLSIHSNFSEPIKDLFRCLCDVHGLEAPTDMDTDYRHCEFEWGGEGWLYYWNITPRPNGVLDITVEFKGKREVHGDEYPVWKIETSTTWQDLAQQVFTQASEMLWMYGFTGYYERWDKDFPAGPMMRLGHLLNGRPVDTNDFSCEIGYLAATR